MAGFNLVAHLYASAGLGITARSFARALEKHGNLGGFVYALKKRLGGA